MADSDPARREIAERLRAETRRREIGGAYFLFPPPSPCVGSSWAPVWTRRTDCEILPAMSLASDLAKLSRLERVESLKNMLVTVATGGSGDEALYMLMRKELLADLGGAYEAADRLGDAETAYRRALSIDPEFADVRRSLARVLERRGAGDEAHREMQAALRVQPNRQQRLERGRP